MTVVIKVAGKFRFLDFPGCDSFRRSALTNDFIDVLQGADDHTWEATIAVEGMIGIFRDPQKAIAAIAGGNLLKEGTEE